MKVNTSFVQCTSDAHSDIKEAIEYVKSGHLVVNGEVIELKVFPVQQSSQKRSDQKYPCRVCEALGQDRKFKTADSMNKHLRSHFYQLLNKQCKYCGKSSFPRIDNHQTICPMKPRTEPTVENGKLNQIQKAESTKNHQNIRPMSPRNMPTVEFSQLKASEST